MKRIRVEDASSGQKVARPLYYPNGTTMLAVGATLAPNVLSRLQQFGFRDIYVFEEGGENVDCRDLVSDAARGAMSRKLGVFFKAVRDIVSRTAGLASDVDATRAADRLSSPEVRRIVKNMRFSEVVGGKELDDFLDGIVSEKDAPMVAGFPRSEQTHHIDHPINIAARSALMARKMGWSPREVRELVQGALLHDIGYHVLPEEILRTPIGQAMHPVCGYHLLRADTGVSLLAAHVAYQHHERFDGKGFPRRLVGLPKLASTESVGPGYTHRYASVVAVADRFDLLQAGYPDGWTMRDDEALATIRSERGTALHPEAVDVLLELTPVYPVGLEVEGIGGDFTGCTGIVTAVAAPQLDKPVIRFVRRGGQTMGTPADVDTRTADVPFRPRATSEGER